MESRKEAWISQGEDVFYKTYNRFPVVFARGRGVHLYDVDDEEYLDFYAGIAVNALGYRDKEYTQCIKEQAENLLHISNYFYNMPSVEAGKNWQLPRRWTGYFLPTAGRRL